MSLQTMINLKNRWQPIVCVALALLCSSPASTQAAGPLAIQDAKIITVSGEVIEKGTILMQDGKIIAIGENVDVPGEAKVIDGTGKVVMPGMVDVHNAAGMSQANERAPVVPFLSVVDSIDPIATYFEECRRNGVTTAAVVPGNSTLIGGKAAIVKTAGQYVNDMLLRRDFALKISLQPSSGSRMTHLAQLRKLLDQAKTAIEKEAEEKAKKDEAKDGEPEKKESDKKEADAKDKATEAKEESKDSSDKKEEGKDSELKKDAGLEALKQAVKGEVPVYIYCPAAMDVTAALRIVSQYDLKPIYVLGRGCHEAATLLSKVEGTVVLDPELTFWETDPRTRKDTKIELPKIYREAGVDFVFQISNPSSRRTLGSSYFWYQAATAVKQGMPAEKALSAITLEPAKLLGIDSLVGSLEVGKDADVMLLSGEPLAISTWVEKTIVGGELVYERSKDEKLERLLNPVAE